MRRALAAAWPSPCGASATRMQNTCCQGPRRSSSITWSPNWPACTAVGGACRATARRLPRSPPGSSPFMLVASLGFATGRLDRVSAAAAGALAAGHAAVHDPGARRAAGDAKIALAERPEHQALRDRRRDGARHPTGPQHFRHARARPEARRLLRRPPARTQPATAARPEGADRRHRRSGRRRQGRLHRPHLHHLSHAGRGSHPRRARQAGRYDRVGVYRPRLLRLPNAAFALDRHRRPAGGQRVREPALRRRWPGQAGLRPRRRRPAVSWRSAR